MNTNNTDTQSATVTKAIAGNKQPTPDPNGNYTIHMDGYQLFVKPYKVYGGVTGAALIQQYWRKRRR